MEARRKLIIDMLKKVDEIGPFVLICVKTSQKDSDAFRLLINIGEWRKLVQSFSVKIQITVTSNIPQYDLLSEQPRQPLGTKHELSRSNSTTVPIWLCLTTNLICCQAQSVCKLISTVTGKWSIDGYTRKKKNAKKRDETEAIVSSTLQIYTPAEWMQINISECRSDSPVWMQIRFSRHLTVLTAISANQCSATTCCILYHLTQHVLEPSTT